MYAADADETRNCTLDAWKFDVKTGVSDRGAELLSRLL